MAVSVWKVSLVANSGSTSFATIVTISHALKMSLSTKESATNVALGESGFSTFAATSRTMSNWFEKVLNTPEKNVKFRTLAGYAKSCDKRNNEIGSKDKKNV